MDFAKDSGVLLSFKLLHNVLIDSCQLRKNSFTMAEFMNPRSLFELNSTSLCSVSKSFVVE